MNPKKFGGLANHDQERWKAPLPDFIARLYFKRFGKERPDEVLSIEDWLKRQKKKNEERKQRKAQELVESQQLPGGPESDPDAGTDDPF